MSERPGRRWRALAFGVPLALVSVLLTAAAAEIGLRLTRDPDRVYPYHRNWVTWFYPSEAITPGVSGPSRFSTNSYGTRGPELGDQRIRILTIGGSTTACTVLDDSETWPAILMQLLNEKAGDPDFVWVTNSGVAGQNSDHHLMHTKYLLPELPQLDYVIVYAGLNDVGKWLYQSDFDPHYLEKQENWNHRMGEAFRESSYTPADWPVYKRLELWKRASILKAAVKSWLARHQDNDRKGIVQDAELQWMREEQERHRQHRTEFVHRAKLDTLPLALDAYESNLVRMIGYIRAAGAEPIYVGQAARNPAEMSDEERDHVWMGAMDGGRAYVEGNQFLEFVALHNERMREVAERYGVLYIDLQALLADAGPVFYDGHHFDERGARIAAERLSDVLWNQVLAQRAGAALAAPGAPAPRPAAPPAAQRASR
jgi:lysophospholipase L1-like esterase